MMAWHAELRINPIGETENLRGADRRGLRLHAPGSYGANAIDVLIHNLSLTGFMVESTSDLAVGESITIDLPEAGTTAATVMWKDGAMHGCEFERPVSLGAVSAAMLRSPGEELGAASAPPIGLPPIARAAIIVGVTLTLWGALVGFLSLF